ncbi:hypothetical protein A2303_00880 [Candidatus Falkowbacteria bacterium RIFOXYB2_FULL_47_14]|uniref:Uncharacterized protein n=1 Tax=Candidatus Falkowbacteria bacterium RIFOXYA2_FULL_47_19 TaxID=1797994 RepID=A0A1F5SG16_9BACT|nr:MAG: hypothetical protein A2227_00080 [Candidatus Falkowbacteria bacterium RIFOXYA2_FULL_47_19]OGF35594.1 MAG: hypothetical protein A2468_06195 [Candidatus Falkowbacteria bacterium RIFOXYC2_FULL_46_15]OGF42922.1 MAG: hypothetical protein A2303_00880 [Candidatus Falkowbacteria bacterium RIFOXYB2_FULL_47_14]
MEEKNKTRTVRLIDLHFLSIREIIFAAVICFTLSAGLVGMSWNKLYDYETDTTVDVGKKIFSEKETEIINRHGRIVDGKYIDNDYETKRFGFALFAGVVFAWIYAIAEFIRKYRTKVEINNPDKAKKDAAALKKWAEIENYLKRVPFWKRILIRSGSGTPVYWLYIFMIILIFVTFVIL